MEYGRGKIALNNDEGKKISVKSWLFVALHDLQDCHNADTCTTVLRGKSNFHYTLQYADLFHYNMVYFSNPKEISVHYPQKQRRDCFHLQLLLFSGNDQDFCFGRFFA